jgi:o-succinylbenzoate synthase
VSRRLLWLSIPFREPFVTSAGAVKARDLVVLRVEQDGATGFGEAAPFEPYDGISIGGVADAMRERATPALPHVRAADEMAFLDLEGRRLGVPAVEFEQPSVPVNCTLAGPTPEAVAALAAAGVDAGYECFKLKVGLADDEARVAAVRDAIGSRALLRLDANGAWSEREARERIERLAPYQIEFVEQPCATLAEMAALRADVAVPITADESIQSAGDVAAAAAGGACDLVSVKLASMGGVSAAREAIEAARAHGLRPYLSSSLDGPWGIAAALQLAAAEAIDMHCGLATLGLFASVIGRALPSPKGGRMEVPPGPGLGVSVSDEAIAEVLVQEL